MRVRFIAAAPCALTHAGLLGLVAGAWVLFQLCHPIGPYPLPFSY